MLITKLRFGLCSLIVGLVFTGQQVFADDWIYTVRKQDTLWGLCEKYTKVKDCWLKIGDYNGVKFPRTLAPGTQIRFPVDWLLDPPAPAEAAFVRGKVTKRNSQGELSELGKGDELRIGDEIIVAENSLAVIQFADRSLMSVEGDSVVRFDVLSKFSATGMVDTRVHLQKGAVQTKVPRRTPRSRFEVSTPSSVAAVRGTDFRVASFDSLTRNEVFEGEVRVANKADQKDLEQGRGLLARKGESLPTPVTLLSAPELLLPVDTAVMPYALDWSDVDGAAVYRLKISRADTPQQTVFSTQTTTSEFVISEVPEACYLIEISAIDAQQFQGMPGQKPLCLSKALASVEITDLEKISKNEVRIAWSAVQSADRYRVEFANDREFSFIADTFETESLTKDYRFDERRPLYVRITALSTASNSQSLVDEVYQAHESARKSEGVFGQILFVLIAIAVFL